MTRIEALTAYRTALWNALKAMPGGYPGATDDRNALVTPIESVIAKIDGMTSVVFEEREIRGVRTRFISRANALRALAGRHDDRARNYEIEQALEQHVDSDANWVVTDWCPFNGRFCRLAEFVPYPHPPLNGAAPDSVRTAIPWNEFDIEKIPAIPPA